MEASSENRRVGLLENDHVWLKKKKKTQGKKN